MLDWETSKDPQRGHLIPNNTQRYNFCRIVCCILTDDAECEFTFAN